MGCLEEWGSATITLVVRHHHRPYAFPLSISSSNQEKRHDAFPLLALNITKTISPGNGLGRFSAHKEIE
jgi:hypothetical protein